MIKLSEIIKTDCYIDCGSNEKLREVYPLIGLPEFEISKYNNLLSMYKFILIQSRRKVETLYQMPHTTLPTHHISQIDLNQ